MQPIFDLHPLLLLSAGTAAARLWVLAPHASPCVGAAGLDPSRLSSPEVVS